MQVRFLQQFLKTESAGGLFLLISATLAIILANSPLAVFYTAWTESTLFLVNDILMALFFLLIGLELKREWTSGMLDKSSVRLPVVAALGGMLVPAICYLLINYHSPATLPGWTIPVATDIAFALGILSLFGRRIPTALKLFLMSLAIFDDIGAILLIAILYTAQLSYGYLALSLVIIGILHCCNKLNQKRLSLYLGLGVILWYACLKTGIHPTIAGVVLALFIPHEAIARQSPLAILEKSLHPWVTFGIMPLFAFCNAGFPLSFNQLTHAHQNPLVMGTVIGLFIGKQIGVFGFSTLLIRARLARLPHQSSWLAFYGVSLLCGIGFTMSLFLGTLSFSDQNMAYLSDVRMGVITGSLLSGIMGAFVLWLALLKRNTRNLS